MAGLLGLMTGILFFGLLLGAQLHRHEAGLWTIRFQRILACGLDYNGPPYTSGSVQVWLTCATDERSWRLWPLGSK
jgi:hypothetical protein